MAVGRHHPDVGRWRNLVHFFFGQVGHQDEIDYAMMVMWGESMGRPQAVGRELGNGARARGLFQHLDSYWNDRVRAAGQFWARRGVRIGTDYNDPYTNIAVAAWLRAIGGWGHWEVTYRWYPEGAYGEQTYWDGWRYQNLARPSEGRPPLGDGQVDGEVDNAGPGFGMFASPVMGATAPTHESSVYGAARAGGTRSHQGIDIGGQAGTPIRASAAGIGYLERSPNGGYKVRIDHGNGWDTRYMHLGTKDGTIQPYAISDGEAVRPGQIIGYMGDSGNAEGPHLHFEIWNGRQPVDPLTTGLMDNTDYGMFELGQFSGEFSMSREDQVEALLLGTFDAMSRAVAGGQRVPIDQQGDAEPMSEGVRIVAPEEDDEALEGDEGPPLRDPGEQLEESRTQSALGRGVV
jgi:hypothetical protein